MAFVYRADEDEALLLREAFGPDVASVQFCDTEPGRGAFGVAVGYDRSRALLGEVELARSRSPLAQRLRRVPDDRDLTVAFWLEIRPADDMPPVPLS